MAAACLHCHTALPANDSIESLPAGRRLAFDAEKGRLWIVCTSCHRWNLTPFESRWEALEECERAYRATRVRQSTDNIGLARLTEGTELVRIGRPLRPEFAAWRYGDQFGLRRTRMIRGAIGGTALAAAGGLALTGMVSAGITLAVPPSLGLLMSMASLWEMNRRASRTIALADGRQVAPAFARLIDMENVEEGWGLEAGCLPSVASSEGIVQVRVRGADCMPILRRLLPRINKSGATGELVSDGVQMIETSGGPEHFGRWAASQRRIWGARQSLGDTGDLSQIPIAARLAFEMAINEDAERRALNGELASLEAAWREAEEVAAVADGLLVPAKIQAHFETLRKQFGPRVD